jgi:glutamate synthase (NADPH/NADH) small chain
MLPNKPSGFMTFTRELPKDEAPESRVSHYKEFSDSLSPEGLQQQAYRCMNCGIPFCHSGCPLGNSIPDFNELVKDDDWEEALHVLHSTNNFPEFTGRVCPAPCEGSCVLGINEPPVTIEMIEKEIAEHGWREGIIQPQPPAERSGKKVAVIGSGPAGLAAAQQLNRAGHEVVVYERDDEPGGLLTYGIPNFKLGKDVVFRRVEQMKAEGVTFRCNAEVGKNVPTAEIDAYDATVIAIGSTIGRTMPKETPGSDLKGIHLAMPFLKQQTRRVLGKTVEEEEILATGKNVVVIGGGDTGSDCVGTSIRQGCASLLNLELMPMPSNERHVDNPWPQWPLVFRTSSSHKEGGERRYSILTKSFEDDGNGNIAALNTVQVEWSEPDENGRRQLSEVAGTEERIPCELVLLAMGFTQPEVSTFVKDLEIEIGPNRFGQGIKADYGTFKTSSPKVFVAGDARRGQSLVVWAIHEGREAARAVDLFLMGHTDLDASNSQGYDALTELAGITNA